MKASDQLRGIVERHCVPETPLADALLVIASGLDEQDRGTAALTERVERLEEEVLARDPDPVTTGGVHVLGHMGDAAA